MDIRRCFEPDCRFEAEYICKCAFPWTYSCKQHTKKHIELPNKTHTFELIFIDPCKGTKEAILKFLTKEKLEHIKLKRKTLASFNQYLLCSQKYIEELIKNLDSSSHIISNCCIKIEEAKKISKQMQDPILELLSLQPNEAIEKVKMIIPVSSDWHERVEMFLGFSETIEKMAESFIKDKFEVNLYKKLSKIEFMQEENGNAIILARSDSANIKDSISLFTNENRKSLKELEQVKEPIKKNTENKTSLLNFQINTTNAFNCKLEEKESTLNIIDTLRNKTAKILIMPNNPELETDFIVTCSAYERNSSLYDPPLMQAYQDYLKAYQLKTSLYHLIKDRENRTNLYIYKTDTETKEEVEISQTQKPLDVSTCITQLPNGKLFCYGNNERSGIAVLIDVNGEVEVLPSGTYCSYSSCIYFNNSIYCFGGDNDDSILDLSSRFDMDRKRWIQLNSLPKADCQCNSIIFNGNILISGIFNGNLLLYSIDIDSFSTIPYNFVIGKKKVLINIERLYLIEFGGWIFESEIGDEMNWTQVGDLTKYHDPYQVYCSYNKGGIYIGAVYIEECIFDRYYEEVIIYECYKFDLNNKQLAIKLP